MTRVAAACLLAWALFLRTPMAHAEDAPVLRMGRGQDGQPIGGQLLYMEDRTGRLGISDFATGRVAMRARPRGEVPNFGFSRSVFWFEARVANETTHDEHLLFELAYPWLDEVDFYAVSASGRVLDHTATGSLRPFASRRILHRHFLFAITPEPGEQLRVLVRVRSSASVQLPLRLWAEHTFVERDQWAALIQGIYVGFMLVMLLYNGFLFLAVRERMYLLYVPMVGGQLVFQYTLHGLAFATLWPDYFVLNRTLPPLMIPLVTWAANAFAVEFLDLKRREPRWYGVTRGTRLLCLLDAVVAPFLPLDVALALGCVLAAGASATVLVALGLVARTATRQVVVLGIAWAPLLAGVFALVAEKFGWVGHSFWTENLVQIGSAIAVVVLSIALGDRINHEREEKLRAQERALEHERAAQRAQQGALSIQRRANDTLAKRVQERTDELGEAQARLADVSTRDALTGLRNRRYFNERFDDEFARGVRESTSLSLLIIDVDHFKEINDRFGNTVGDQCLVAIADLLRTNIARATDTVARYGGEEFVVLLPNTDTEGCRQVAEALRTSVEALSMEANAELIPLSVSVGGICAVPRRGAHGDVFLTRADEALDEAKQRGRNRIHVFETPDLT